MLAKAKEFLESLQAYNTPGKLKNFKYDAADIKGYQATFTRLKEVEDLQVFCGELAQFTQYLSAAEAVLPEDHPWVTESKQKRTELLTEIRKPAQRESETFKADALKQLKKLKAGYIKVYLDLYRKARLSLAQDKEKKDLLQDYRLKRTTSPTRSFRATSTSSSRPRKRCSRISWPRRSCPTTSPRSSSMRSGRPCLVWPNCRSAWMT